MPLPDTPGWRLSLAEPGTTVQGADAVAQAIRVVLTTPLGADPTRPDFGCDAWRHLDKPVASARPHVVGAVAKALARWVPEALVDSVQVEQSSTLGQVLVIIAWALGGVAVQRTEVALGQ